MGPFVRSTSSSPFAPAPFVGRDEQMALLVERLDAAANDHGSVVLISGEPGVGKTRLGEELLAEARGRGFFTMVGHCSEVDTGLPFTAFVEALEYAVRLLSPDLLRQYLGDDAAEISRLVPAVRRVFPDLPPPPKHRPEEGRRHLLNAMRDFSE